MSEDTPILDLKTALLADLDLAIAEREKTLGYTLAPAYVLGLREFIIDGRGTFNDLWTFAHALCLGKLPGGPYTEAEHGGVRFGHLLANLIPTEKADAFAEFRTSFTRRPPKATHHD